VYVPEMGRWTRRDPIGYVDGVGLYEYAAARAIVASDASGLGCTISVTCRLSSSALVGSCCRNCTWICTETNRIDSVGSCGCNDLPSQRLMRSQTTQKCNGFCQLTGFGDPPSSNICMPLITKEKYIIGCTGIFDRSCDSSVCNEYCDGVETIAIEGCERLPGRPAQALCKFAARQAGAICRDSCNVWCRQSVPVGPRTTPGTRPASSPNQQYSAISCLPGQCQSSSIIESELN